jgi:hypothetical protein
MYHNLLRADIDDSLHRIEEYMKEVMLIPRERLNQGVKVTPIFDESGNLKDFKFERIH